MGYGSEIILMADGEPLEAYLDFVDWTHFRGWAYNPAVPEAPLWLEALVDDAPPIRFLANMLREDLTEAGIGTGRYAFKLSFSRPLDSSIPHRVMVRRASDGAALRNSPWYLPAAPAGSAAARLRFEAVFDAEIQAARHTENLAPLTRFLVTQVDRLLQAAVDLDSGRAARQLFRTRWAETLDGEPLQFTPPDPRPLALFVGFDLPKSGAAMALLGVLQSLRLRVGVAALRGLPADGPEAEALLAAGHTVHGAPWFGSIEDILRRHTPDFRVIVLHGAVAAAAYAVTARLHHPRARVLAWIEDTQDAAAAIIASQLLCDATLVSTEAAAGELRRRVPGRPVHVLPAEGEPDALAAVLRDVIEPGGGVSPG